jgi:hypothetical protein
VSDRLFPRAIAVTVAKVTTGSFFTTRDEVTVADLRVSFSIEKHLGSEPNTCTCSIFNLSESSRALFEGKPLQVRIDAGYDSQLGALFVGDLAFGQSIKNGTEWETKLQLADGHRAYHYARHARAYPKGTSTIDMVKDMAGAMGLKVPKNAADALDLVRQISSGNSFAGPSRKMLTQVLARHGRSWSIQDGGLQILGDDEVRSGDALVIDEGSGMIESPEFGPPKKKGGKRLLTVKNLLYPALSPGRKIRVVSLRVNGFFKIERVTHTGDTAGGDWMSTIEAVPV